MLRNLIREILLNEVREFDEWLSPDVMGILLSRYAMRSPVLGALKWDYKELPRSRWGQFEASGRILYVNKAKTKGLFKQQVETILHEIQHWNQFANEGDRYAEQGGELDDRRHKIALVRAFNRKYEQLSHVHGYWDNPFEVDARDYATKNLKDAMDSIGRHYGGKVEGGDLDMVIEELIDDYDPDGPALTRFEIGTALRDYDLNTPANMKDIVAQLQDLGVAVR